MGTIYKITNILNGKSYIGKTEQKVELRWAVHKSNVSKLDFPLYRAIRKYGIENFLFEVIEDGINSEEALNKAEIYYIKLYNTYGENGYNATPGGEGHTTYDAKDIAEKYKELKDINKVADFFGCSRKPVLQAIKKYNINTGHKKSVYQIDKQTGEIINIFQSQNEAAKILFNDINRAKNISAACRGKIKSAYGYLWRIAEDI